MMNICCTRCSMSMAPSSDTAVFRPRRLSGSLAQEKARPREIHDRLLPVTRAVYHRGSHMEGTVALKHGLVARGILEHATVRSPLLPLDPGADVDIANALRAAGLVPTAKARAA